MAEKKVRTCVSVGGQIRIGERANVYVPSCGKLIEVVTSQVLHTIAHPSGDIDFQTENTLYKCKVI